MPGPIPVLLLAGEAWEAQALTLLREDPSLVLVRRCLDLADLLAVASAREARVAIVDGEAGLDASALHHLEQHGVAVLAVAERATSAAEQLRSLGVTRVVGTDLAGVALLAQESVAEPTVAVDDPGLDLRAAPGGHETALLPTDAAPGPAERVQARVVAVWGPAGAPGRTTVATGLAAALAHRGEPMLLVDADPQGGAVGQYLGVLDEPSGLLAVARAVHGGSLDPGRLAAACREVAPRLAVLTGLPRADRWLEARRPTLDRLLAVARADRHVVLDCGPSLEAGDDPDLPGRHDLTLDAVLGADAVVVVGSADPVGLTRLVRGLAELREAGIAADRVVLNRVRSSIGASAGELKEVVAPHLAGVPLHLLPDDRAAHDRALAAGRTLVESGDSVLLRGIQRIATELLPVHTSRADSGTDAATAGGAAGVRRRAAVRVRRR